MEITFTLTQPEVVQIMVFKKGIELYLKSGMQITRTATPKRMREFVGKRLGKTYPRSRQGLESAYADLCALVDAINGAIPST